VSGLLAGAWKKGVLRGPIDALRYHSCGGCAGRSRVVCCTRCVAGNAMQGCRPATRPTPRPGEAARATIASYRSAGSLYGFS
jgi:hypothetical protein